MKSKGPKYVKPLQKTSELVNALKKLASKPQIQEISYQMYVYFVCEKMQTAG